MYKFVLALLVATAISGALAGQQRWEKQVVSLQSRWFKEVEPSNALTAYPRPQMSRSSWQNLNGLWDYAITRRQETMPATFDGQILVPFPLESALSGVKKSLQPGDLLWYRRQITHAPEATRRTILHFGAVDNTVTVYINGEKVGGHQGGYTAFSFDITEQLKAGINELLMAVTDSTDKGVFPAGKQVLNPADIYYTPSSGIWQTVWLETVPQSYIRGLTITPDIDHQTVAITADAPEGTTIQLDAFAGGKRISGLKGRAGDKLQLPVPAMRVWSPEDPFLYDLKVTLIKAGRPVDTVTSYFGMRKVSLGKDEQGHERIFLNNKYTYNLGVLDQGFWPDGLMTAPTDEALAFDIKAIKAMGFNTIRKHIKVEPARWYYHADKLGILVWQDMVNPNQGLPEGAKAAFEKQCGETVAQLRNNPSIIMWVLFNERWGAYDQPRLTRWLKELDPTRLVNGHSGELLWVNEKLRFPADSPWMNSDIADVHSYPDPMNAPESAGKARILGEFGGIGVFVNGHQWSPESGWGYIQVTPAGLKGRYATMVQHLRLLEREGLAGSIYTQPFDVEGEENGLLTYDREVIKIPFAQIRSINATILAHAGTAPDVAARDADMTDPNLAYSVMLASYVNGKRDPVFVKSLAKAAKQVGDKAGEQRLSTEYIRQLKAPVEKSDLAFVLQNTSHVTDPGFPILQAALSDSGASIRPVEVKIMNVVYADLMDPVMRDPKAIVNWAEMEKRLTPFGKPGNELLLRAKTIYYLNNADWKNYVTAVKVYMDKYGQNLPATERNMFSQALNKAEQSQSN